MCRFSSLQPSSHHMIITECNVVFFDIKSKVTESVPQLKIEENSG